MRYIEEGFSFKNSQFVLFAKITNLVEFKNKLESLKMNVY